MAPLGTIALGITVLYMVTTFVMSQDIRDNTREMVELLEQTGEDTADS